MFLFDFGFSQKVLEAEAEVIINQEVEACAPDELPVRWLTKEEKERINNLSNQKVWMRWGGLGLISLGTGLFVISEGQVLETLGATGAGLGVAGFVWSFRF